MEWKYRGAKLYWRIWPKTYTHSRTHAHNYRAFFYCVVQTAKCRIFYSSLLFAQSVFNYSNSSRWIELVVWLTLLYICYSMRSIKMKHFFFFSFPYISHFGFLFGSGSFLLFRPFIIIQKRAVSDLLQRLWWWRWRCHKFYIYMYIFFGPILSMIHRGNELVNCLIVSFHFKSIFSNSSNSPFTFLWIWLTNSFVRIDLLDVSSS